MSHKSQIVNTRLTPVIEASSPETERYKQWEISFQPSGNFQPTFEPLDACASLSSYSCSGQRPSLACSGKPGSKMQSVEDGMQVSSR